MANTSVESVELILGSASPRRADLLRELGLTFIVKIVDIDEQALVDSATDVGEVVTRIAQAKFSSFPARPAAESTLITADTMVALGSQAIGKPDSDEHLATMLQAMSGRPLTIATAVCIGPLGTTPSTVVVTTMVRLRTLSANEIATYVATGTGKDKAGGLALQAEAGDFIASVEGCWSNVLGLPICAVAAALDRESTGLTQAQRCSTSFCGAAL